MAESDTPGAGSGGARPSNLTAPEGPPEIRSLSQEQLHQSLQQFDSLSDAGLYDSAQELLSTVVEALGGESSCCAREFASFPGGNFVLPAGAWEPADHRRYIAVGGLDKALGLIQKKMLVMANQGVGAAMASMRAAARDRMSQTTNHQCSADGGWSRDEEHPVTPAQLVDYARGIWIDLPYDLIASGSRVLLKGRSCSAEEFKMKSFDASTDLYQVVRSQHSTAATFKRERLQVLEEEHAAEEEEVTHRGDVPRMQVYGPVRRTQQLGNVAAKH